MQEETTIPYPLPPPSDKADLLDKINPDEPVEILCQRLMGRELNNRGEWVINKELKKCSISKIGAWNISNLLLSIASRSTSISKLSDKEIRKRAYSLTDTAIRNLLANWKEYGITNTAQIRYVADIVYSVVFIVMKQSEGEGVRKMIIGTRSESHHVVSEEEKKKSFWRR